KRAAASKAASREPGKKSSPKVLLGAVAAGALVVLGVVGFLLFSGPGTGSLMVSVQPSMGVEVRIDGQVHAQNQVIQLPEGPHTVTATAPGHRPAEKQVIITRQSPAVVSLVLTPNSQAEQPEERGTAGTGASAGTGLATAQAASDAPAEPTQEEEPAAEEPPSTFEAVFEGPSGAEIEVEGKSVGKMPGVKLAGLTLGQRYAFTARRAGYKTYSGSFSSDDGDTELVVRFELEKEAPPPPTAESRPTVRQPPPSRSPRPSRTVKGKLACSSRPPGAQIWVNGRYSGRETPVALGNPLVLPVGSHTIVFKLDGKQSKPKKVTITEGEVAKLINVPLE
ncbi:MAG TPA: PEGA domain-containing protein, partial [Myxococcaceae bacterium]|nr:PEGA domain-containing protein [Myxococcaceae bacterium]